MTAVYRDADTGLSFRLTLVRSVKAVSVSRSGWNFRIVADADMGLESLPGTAVLERPMRFCDPDILFGKLVSLLLELVKFKLETFKLDGLRLDVDREVAGACVKDAPISSIAANPSA